MLSSLADDGTFYFAVCRRCFSLTVRLAIEIVEVKDK